MAAVDWPWASCTVRLSSYDIDEDENVRRTQFDSGLIQQKRISVRPMTTRTIEVLVKISQLAAWRQWIAANGADWFNFRDWEKTDYTTDPPTAAAVRDVRIRGGKIPLQFIEDELLDGEEFFRGRATLEGFEL